MSALNVTQGQKWVEKEKRTRRNPEKEHLSQNPMNGAKMEKSSKNESLGGGGGKGTICQKDGLNKKKRRRFRQIN